MGAKLSFLPAIRIRMATVVLAAGIQVALVLQLGSTVSGGDAFTYLKLASDWSSLARLTSPEAFQDNFWPAGYSGFLQMFSGFGDSSIVAIRLAQVLMAVSIAWMAGELAKQYSMKAAVATTFVVAFWPTYFWAVWAIGYELLLGWLLTISLVLLMGRTARRNSVLVALSGITAGLALIVQFRAFAVIPVLVVLAYKIDLRRFVFFLVGLGIPSALWTLRSWVSVGKPTPWSANGGWNLWNGNNPVATGHNIFPLPELPAGTNSYGSAAIEWILTNPSHFVELCARRLIFLFYPTDIGEITNRFPAEAAISLIQWLCSAAVVMLLIVFLGAWFWNIDTKLNYLKPIFLFAIGFLAINVIFIVESRFRIPVEAEILAICVPTFLELRSRRKIKDELAVSSFDNAIQ